MTNLASPASLTLEDQGVSRRRLVALFLGGCALTAFGAPAFAQRSGGPIVTSDEGLVTGQVGITGRDGILPAYAAYPAAKGKYAVIVVISEALGVNDYIRDVCRRLARLGYLAVAPDLFYRAGDPGKATDSATVQKIVTSASNEQVMGDIAAVVFWAGRQPSAQKRFGVTGFSWGGAAVWMIVQRFKEMRAGVAWYGRLSKPAEGAFLGAEVRPWPLDIVPTLRAPVLGLYAGQDPGIPERDVTRMNTALINWRKKGSQLILYEKAQHGFHDDYLPAYNQDAANDGWARMLEHFERNGLKGKPPRD